MKRTLTHLIPALLAVFCAVPALAAREFTPQSGLWMIPSENNGQPGRGFSLDVQGNTAFLQVFNYEKSGAATFHTAVGQLDDAGSMTVPLLRFKNGRYLGGPPQVASEDGTPGNVSVRFTDGLNGTIQFPGESQQPIARFVVPEALPYWWSKPAAAPEIKAGGIRDMSWISRTSSGTQILWRSSLSNLADGSLSLQLSRVNERDLYPTPHTFDCRLEEETQVVDCLAQTSTNEATTGVIVDRVRFRTLGRDIVGFMRPTSNHGERWLLNGFNEGSTRYTCTTEPCSYLNNITTWAYSSSAFPGGACIPEMCNFTYSLMVLPSNGAWIIDDESNGQPGRGVFLDVQENTAIIQTSDYLQSGEPTFHMGAGSLRASPNGISETTAEMPLIRYQGGRHFGGPAQSGSEAANAGTLQLMISPLKDSDSTDFATGSIRLSTESAKPMHRLRFEASSNLLADKLGEYFIRWKTAGGYIQRWERLTRLEDIFATNDDGTVKCYVSTPSEPDGLRCAWLPSPNISQAWLGSASLTISPFQRKTNPNAPDMLYRTRDQHGNWLGLGAVDLPGLAIPQDQ
ncbi:hypothetical protein [Diaphorobacter caeni]|uniref:hypothetical protein n=1 Tax=Diaphorobacter caeni TaxID=2784387 RepID=UPI00188E037D|nr:hypothetical protein [Diaphorobacter caeni]MBF5005190.1 hypothetical protein [Diaphorobacter caeni]